MCAFDDDLLLGSAQLRIILIRDVAVYHQLAVVGHVFVIRRQPADYEETVTVVQDRGGVFCRQRDWLGHQSGINADFFDFLRQGFNIFFRQNGALFKQAVAALDVVGQNPADQSQTPGRIHHGSIWMREFMHEWESCYMAALEHFHAQDVSFLLRDKRAFFKQHFAFAAQNVFGQIGAFHPIRQRQFLI